MRQDERKQELHHADSADLKLRPVAGCNNGAASRDGRLRVPKRVHALRLQRPNLGCIPGSNEMNVDMSPLSDVGEAKRDLEGTYRRGFHQAVAMVTEAARANPQLSADQLQSWVDGAGSQWRYNLPMDRQIMPPQIP